MVSIHQAHTFSHSNDIQIIHVAQIMKRVKSFEVPMGK